MRLLPAFSSSSTRLRTGVFLVGFFVAQRRGLIVNHPFAVDQNKLRHNESLHRRNPQEGKDLVAGGPTDRKLRLLLFDKSINQQICIVVECHIDGLKSARPEFALNPAHDMGGSLAMRTGGEDEFERDDFAPVLTEQFLALARNREGKLRRLPDGRR